MTNSIVANQKPTDNPTNVLEAIFARLHSLTPYPPPGEYVASFDEVGDSLEATINCPDCRNNWTVQFPSFDLLCHYACHYGYAISPDETSPISWVLTCPRCAMNASDHRARYADYLRSPHWQSTRAAAIERAGGRCQLCNAEGALQVHHRTYKNKGHEQPGDLIVLCADCHRMFHECRELAS